MMRTSIPDMTPPKTKNSLFQSDSRSVISERLGIWMRLRRRSTMPLGGVTRFKVRERCVSRDCRSESWEGIIWFSSIL